MPTYEELYTKEAVAQMEKDGITVPAKEAMTCHRCARAEVCDLAWDPYNTDGDCLADR